MSALAADHRNDVVATLVALVFGIIGMTKQITDVYLFESNFIQVQKRSMVKLSHENYQSLIPSVGIVHRPRSQLIHTIFQVQ